MTFPDSNVCRTNSAEDVSARSGPRAIPSIETALAENTQNKGVVAPTSEACLIFPYKRAAILGVLLCAGCSSIHTKTPEGESIVLNEADFTAYFEHVFRHHNNVVNESLYITSDPLSKFGDSVSNAETKMNHACQPLNEAASSAATGETPDFWTRMKLEDAVPECEAATRKLEKMLIPQQ